MTSGAQKARRECLEATAIEVASLMNKEMPNDIIYLDNNATTRVAPEVFEAMRPYLAEAYGNPSSAHTFGRRMRASVERAREQVAALLGAADADELVFTSCGSESDNWAI